MMSDIQLYCGDCLEVMKDIPDNSIDTVIADIPYGTTACKWDTVIPFEPMWESLERITKLRAAIVLFGSQPFTSFLISSNIEIFRYCWYWKKERGTGFAQSGKRPLMIIEDIAVFYQEQPLYTPEKRRLEKPYRHVLPVKKGEFEGKQQMTQSIKNGNRVYKEYTHETAHQLLEFSRDNACKKSLHPTQKPVALLEYLVKTYTNEGDTVLDFTMGSGTTLVACVKTKRNGIGIDIEEKYVKIAKNRVRLEQSQMRML